VIVTATGHRLHLLPGYRGDGSSGPLRATLVEVALDTLEEWSPDLLITGMATGWDMAMAIAAMIRNTPFHAYLPFEGQARNWSRTDQDAYRGLLDEAEDVRVISSTESRRAYYERDVAMVDALTGPEDRLLALWLGDPNSGTAITIDYAMDWLVPWTNYRDQFMEKVHEKGLATRR
jgi:hypothetical protein